jgi:hypothetical protein
MGVGKKHSPFSRRGYAARVVHISRCLMIRGFVVLIFTLLVGDCAFAPLAIAAAPTTAPAATSPATTQPAMVRYVDPDPQFSIDRPADWELVNSPAAKVKVAFRAPKSPSQQFRDNIQIASSALPADFKPSMLEKSMSRVKDGIAKGANVQSFIEDQPMMVDGYSAHRLTFIASSNGNDIEQTQIMVVEPGRLLNFSFSSSTSHFDQFKPLAEQMIQSIKIEKAN